MLPLILLFVGHVLAQRPTPCPSIFAYEPQGLEHDRWYGRVTLTSPVELNGIFLHIRLDSEAELLGNWFGETSSSDNVEFLIKNRSYHFEPNRSTLSVRFFVKYNINKTVPSVTNILLNGREVCEPQFDERSTLTTRLYVSLNNSTSSYQRSSTTTQASNEEGEFFGDFSESRKPLITAGTQLSYEDNDEDACGIVTVRARPLITYGESTNEGEYPWHVALYRYKGVNIQYICGGNLISRNFVLTAAHCVINSRTGSPIKPEVFLIYLGKHNLHRLNGNVQTLQVDDLKAHPNYNASTFQNDLAILKLDRAVKITDYVRPICLWGEDTELSRLVNKTGTVVGWGFDETGEVTENLMQAKMPIVSTETCLYSNPGFFSRFTSEKTYCAGFRNGTSACTGDSGGGMVFPKSGTSGSNAIWQLRGMVSLSSALQNSKVVCDTSNYIVFTDVAKHLDWIEQTCRQF